MDTFNKEVLDMCYENMNRNAYAIEASLRLRPLDILAGLRVVVLCLVILILVIPY